MRLTLVAARARAPRPGRSTYRSGGQLTPPSRLLGTGTAPSPREGAGPEPEFDHPLPTLTGVLGWRARLVPVTFGRHHVADRRGLGDLSFTVPEERAEDT